jgi:hypothetical protein
MRQVISGTGADTTATVKAYLAAGNELRLADLYLIGEADDPLALWLTNWESPLLWSAWGTFQPAVITRGSIISEIGLDSKTLDVNWSPKIPTFTSSILTTSPYALARLGTYDNRRFRLWRCFMPTPGDANTYGAMELFGGVIGNCEVTRGSIKFTVQDYLYVLDQKVPTGVIECTNPLASYIGGTPPAGMSVIPVFEVVTGSVENIIYGDCITSGFTGHIFTTDSLNNGYLVFAQDSTLAGLYSVVARNSEFIDGGSVHHNQFQIYSPMPWVPTPGDKFYVSAQSPIDSADPGSYPFPYVPSPETAI